MQNYYDVIIVGGGLTGNSLALALKDTGLKIAIIEGQTNAQLKQSPNGERALALAAGTVNRLIQLNIWQTINHCASAIKNIHISDKGHFAKTRLSALENNIDALGYVITARDLENHLMDLVEKAHIEVLSSTQVIQLDNEVDFVQVHLKQGDNQYTIKTKLIVGADGGHSTVRELLNISQQINQYEQTALVTTVKTTLAHHNTAFERFTQSGPLALLPLNKSHCAVVWTRTSKEAQCLLNVNEIEFITKLQDCFGYKLGKLTLTAPIRAFPLALIRAEKMISHRAVIIGNAAHQLHPVAGQGFNLALRDVMVLADKLIAVSKQNVFDCGDNVLLQNYAKARQKDHDLTIQFTDKVVRLFSNDFIPLAALRSVGLLTLDHLPFAKKLLAQKAMGLSS